MCLFVILRSLTTFPMPGSIASTFQVRCSSIRRTIWLLQEGGS
jgi:hypothetical protein